jgi:hypothetical protein
MKDKYFLAAGFALATFAFIVYMLFYDILIPGITNGSYRAVVGVWFAIPSFLLAYGQALIAGTIIYFASRTFTGKASYAKSFFISSTLVMIFSLTYVIFPFFGPFYFIVFATGIAPPNVLFIEVAWAAVAVVVCTLLLEKLHGVRRKYALFTALVTLIFVVVAAS